MFANNDGTVFEVVIDDPCWLVAGWATEPTGDRWLWVYRSVLTQDTSVKYRPVVELTLGLELLRREAGIPDESMMRSTAELSVWA